MGVGAMDWVAVATAGGRARGWEADWVAVATAGGRARG